MYRNRQIFESLEKQLQNRKVTILLGSRQVGKTTLLKQLYNHFKDKYRSLFVDLDIYSNFEKFSSYENAINTLKLNGYDGKDLFVLYLDEFHRYGDISIIIKNLVDNHPNVKIYASGSSSLSIRSKVQESLAGRKRIVMVYPLSFVEYLSFIDRDDLVDKISKIDGIETENFYELLPEHYQELNNFLVYGGYPEVVLSKREEKKEVLSSIFDLYIKKDLVDYLKIEKIKNAKTIINYLAINNGREINFNQLAQISGVDNKTAKNYVEILSGSFLIHILNPWFKNKNKELTKMPKIYYLDNGVRNYFIDNFADASLREDISYLFEGFIVSELIKNGIDADNIKYWRTKNKEEVDIIIDNPVGPKAVEVKYKKSLKKSDFSTLKRFLLEYPEFKGFLINLSSNKPIENIKLLLPFRLNEILETSLGT